MKKLLLKRLLVSAGTMAAVALMIPLIVPHLAFERSRMKPIDWKSYESYSLEQLISEFPGPINWQFHDLCGWSLSERGPVLKELHHRYPREAIPYVKEFIGSEDAAKRAYAIQYLAAFPSEDILPKLRNMLDDPDGKVAFFAFEAIKVYYFGIATFCYRQDQPEHPAARDHYKSESVALLERFQGMDRKAILKNLVENCKYPHYYHHLLEVFTQREAVEYLLNLALSSRADKDSIYFHILRISGNDLCPGAGYTAELDQYVSSYVRHVLAFGATEFAVWLALGRLQHYPSEGFPVTSCQSEAEAIRVASQDIDTTIEIWKSLYQYFDGLQKSTTPPKYSGISEKHRCVTAIRSIESPKVAALIHEVTHGTKR